MTSTVYRIFWVVLVSWILASLSVWLHPEGPPWNPDTLGEGEVDLEIVSQWTVPVLWVDARSAQDYGQGHIPEALNLSEEDWDTGIVRFLEVWDPESYIVVYCDSRECGASSQLANRLREDYGIGNVYVLKGGWRSWQEQN